MVNKRILLTGAHGFLGRHVREALEDYGVFADDIVAPSHDEYDLADERHVSEVYECEPDVVIHLAAECGGIGANRSSPAKYIYDNLAMGLHMIEYARLAGVEKFVQIGTVCSYPKFTPVPFCEADLWNGYPEETNAPYGIAKKALLVALQAYRAQYGMNGIYLIPANMYGPGDNFNLDTSHVIPAMIRKLCVAKACGHDRAEMWGTGKASREFLYVKDCAYAIVKAAEGYDHGEPVNIGTGQEITIADLADKIADIIGYDGEIVWDSSQPDGQPRRCLDVTRARDMFDFEARVGLDQGLRQTIKWWQAQC